MFYKILFFIFSLFLLLPAFIPVFSFVFAEETRVCGTDKVTYPSLTYANKNKIKISYDFPCIFPKDEIGLHEKQEYVQLTGKLLNIFENPEKRQLLLKDNRSGKDFFVIQSEKLNNKIHEYFPGDQVGISGMYNKNTGVIIADSVVNKSAKSGSQTVNCILEFVSDSHVICLNKNDKYNYPYDADTKFVSGFINPARQSDLAKEDNIRIRLDKNNYAELVMVMERGNLKYFKNNIFDSKAKLLFPYHELGLFSVIVDGNIDSIDKLNYEGKKIIELNITNETMFVKKYFGLLRSSDFYVDNDLYIVAKAKDDGTYEAITIKNNSVWK